MIAQLAPATIGAVRQVLVWAKSPVMAILETVTDAVSLMFDSVIVCDVLVLLRLWAAKLSPAGVREIPPLGAHFGNERVAIAARTRLERIR